MRWGRPGREGIRVRRVRWGPVPGLGWAAPCGETAPTSWAGGCVLARRREQQSTDSDASLPPRSVPCRSETRATSHCRSAAPSGMLTAAHHEATPSAPSAHLASRISHRSVSPGRRRAPAGPGCPPLAPPGRGFAVARPVCGTWHTVDSQVAHGTPASGKNPVPARAYACACACVGVGVWLRFCRVRAAAGLGLALAPLMPCAPRRGWHSLQGRLGRWSLPPFSSFSSTPTGSLSPFLFLSLSLPHNLLHSQPPNSSSPTDSPTSVAPNNPPPLTMPRRPGSVWTEASRSTTYPEHNEVAHAIGEHAINSGRPAFIYNTAEFGRKWLVYLTVPVFVVWIVSCCEFARLPTQHTLTRAQSLPSARRCTRRASCTCAASRTSRAQRAARGPRGSSTSASACTGTTTGRLTRPCRRRGTTSLPSRATRRATRASTGAGAPSRAGSR